MILYNSIKFNFPIREKQAIRFEEIVEAFRDKYIYYCRYIYIYSQYIRSIYSIYTQYINSQYRDIDLDNALAEVGIGCSQ